MRPSSIWPQSGDQNLTLNPNPTLRTKSQIPSPNHRTTTMPPAGDDDPAVSDEATDSDDFAVGDQKRRRISDAAAGGGGGGGEESRRMFQKLWTDADEIRVLEGFLDFTTRRGTTHATYQHDTGPFFDEIRPRLQFDFNKNQIMEKLRRLKKKYRNAAARIDSGRGSVFKNPHDRAAYEISRQIWCSTFMRKPKNSPCSGAVEIEEAPTDRSGGGGVAVPVSDLARVTVAVVEGNSAPVSSSSVPPPLPAPLASGSDPSVEEEAVRICLAPLFKELLQSAIGGSAATMAAWPLWVLPPHPPPADAEGDERWRRQRILELEVYLKRIELVEECVRSVLDNLRSKRA
ncbi:Mediator-associated protein 1 [Apostasia shenzhenica]|uniref:Mediator-associated protein 1 n=1 Tax=Apostasia shenzhenica TaxID=1088818 RepID=A0A2I0B5G5_9ASPA|nr:Mediator-associated protein 1 [Apostasia shenzhenica]